MKRILGVLMCMLLLAGCESNEVDELSAEEILFNEFAAKLVAGDDEGLHQLLSQESQERNIEEEFLARHLRIYSDIGASNLVLTMEEIEDETEDTVVDNIIPFTLTMDTIAGEVTLDFQLPFVEEDGELRVIWSENLIFPDMLTGDRVRVTSLRASRGNILDRYGRKLASDGELWNVGIHPALFNEDLVEEMAEALDISEDIIRDLYEADPNSDLFVPIVTTLPNLSQLQSLKNRENEGILIRSTEGRVYKDHEAVGRLLGFVGTISAEALAADEEGIYTASSMVGQAGLEQVYENTLRGINGWEIFVEREGVNVQNIARTEPQHGEDLTLTIDSELQVKVYEAMNGERGSASAVDPTTGEILALVSSPSYNSNMFTTYMTRTEAALWEKREVTPRNVLNRFSSRFSPGSTFKLHTAVIGLENGTLDPNEIRVIEGREAAVGGHNVTRISDNHTRIGLTEAVKLSDNIYFAQEALAIGSEDFIAGMDKFTIGTELNIGFPLDQSQISNSGTLDSQALLIETGFGQGEILATTLNIALDYSMLSNTAHPASIMNPTLILTDDFEPSILKESIVSEENLAILQDAFLAVVDDSAGTGRDARISGVRLAGKTGTAETNTERGERGSEHGWFVATDLDTSRISLAVMIEDSQNLERETLGVVDMVREVLVEFLR